jgi:hypothetical protein
MKSIVVNPKDEQEFAFVTELLEKLGVDAKFISEEDIEDIGLSLLLKQADRSDLVSEDEIRSKLKS